MQCVVSYLPPPPPPGPFSFLAMEGTGNSEWREESEKKLFSYHNYQMKVKFGTQESIKNREGNYFVWLCSM